MRSLLFAWAVLVLTAGAALAVCAPPIAGDVRGIWVFYDNDIRPEHVLIDSCGMLARHYGTVGLPVTLFIGTDGLLAHTHVGEISREVLLSRIARLQ